ncbi:hypothetical protein B0H19DRAFT_1261760 [Mycena capillaripes]|nr:hypothetical protein B0H19DRAFT_1261760 [Mycena capillaripes]
MTDVEELRTRIERICTEIACHDQKEVLKQLERDKSLLKRQLNEALDPVARLPLEISGEIFIHSLPARPEPGSPHPILLLNICHAWTDIALSSPRLWTGIYIALPCTDSFKNVLPTWLRRTSNLPLSIILGGIYIDQDVAADIWGHGPQLKHLEIHNKEDKSLEPAQPMNLFGVGGPGPLPSLETLTIRGGLESWGRIFHGPQILQLLRMGPHLIECVFEGMRVTSDLETIEKLVHPALRRLMFGEYGKCPRGNDNLLRCLSLPQLETLSLSMRPVSGAILLSFLKRSSPPLRTLVLRPGRLDFSQLHQCLCLVPTLIRFELWYPGSRLLKELFAAFADSPILPNLHSLTIYTDSSVISYSSCTTLLRALAARRAHLQIVHIEMSADSWISLKPTADILAAFRDLIVDGMKIHIGTEFCNFVSD